MMTPLPETGYLRLPQIIGDPKANPPIPALIPVSRTTWWAGVSSGFFPKPIKLGPRITAWRVEAIRDLIQQAGDWEEWERDRKSTLVESSSVEETPHA